jgi:phosphonate transport system substrate-binding protein
MNHSESKVATRSFSGNRFLVTTVVILIVAAAAYWYGVNSVKILEPPALQLVGLDDPVEHRLSSQYTDADGDLVADPPQDINQWIDPPTINFSYLATEQDRYADVWANFVDFVGQYCNRTVTFVHQDSVDGQLRAIQNGELHVAGINSGSVPLAVNYCGFVPMCSFGNNGEIATYTMKIIARSDSTVRKLENIRGRQLALTNPTSNSGWKAPMILLLREYKLKPLLDYDIVGLRTHADAINAIAAGEQKIASVASDELALAQSVGLINKDDYVEIYESDPFCNNVLGYVHNLKPELAETIKKAIYEFDWKDSKLADQFIKIGASQLVPVDYKKDFKLIRHIDNAMGRRHAIEEHVEMNGIILNNE